MVRIPPILVMALSLLLLVNLAAAKMETVDLGQFIAEFDNGSMGEDQTTVYPPILGDESIGLYDTCTFRVEPSDSHQWYEVNIDDYSSLVDVSPSGLRHEIEKWGLGNEKYDWIEGASVGSRPAVMAKETYKGSVTYDTAYSPDSVGDKGSIVARIYTIFSLQYTEEDANKFLSKLKIRRSGITKANTASNPRHKAVFN